MRISDWISDLCSSDLLENTGDFEPLRKPSRCVLHVVNSHIDRSVDKSLFNLLRKEPFPTNLGESSVLHAIRRRLNDNDLDSIRFMQFWVGNTQRPPDPMCLRKSHWTASGSDEVGRSTRLNSSH